MAAVFQLNLTINWWFVVCERCRVVWVVIIIIPHNHQGRICWEAFQITICDSIRLGDIQVPLFTRLKQIVVIVSQSLEWSVAVISQVASYYLLSRHLISSFLRIFGAVHHNLQRKHFILFLYKLRNRQLLWCTCMYWMHISLFYLYNDICGCFMEVSCNLSSEEISINIKYYRRVAWHFHW